MRMDMLAFVQNDRGLLQLGNRDNSGTVARFTDYGIEVFRFVESTMARNAELTDALGVAAVLRAVLELQGSIPGAPQPGQGNGVHGITADANEGIVDGGAVSVSNAELFTESELVCAAAQTGDAHEQSRKAELRVRCVRHGGAER